MPLIDVSKRPDRHKELLDEAERFDKRALICFERGDPENLQRGNSLAMGIQPVTGGDIGWQIVDIGIILAKHEASLKPVVKSHLTELLADSINAWSDREFGRGNVNHPIIATWLYAATGSATGCSAFSQKADERLKRFIHIFSQAGDMSEYNSPTYLGPTLVGLANLGMYAALESTRIRARMIEERIWINFMARWHAPTQQLAGPHSRAYADSTIGFGGIARYLAFAVLNAAIFWDTDLSVAYDHNHDAEWAGKIAASTFSLPDCALSIAENKPFPYTIISSTDGEDYTVDGKEIYRGGWGSLTTYLTDDFCLGSSERPYVDGGQNETCIAYWRRNTPVKNFLDLRSMYFRYITNNRLPGQENVYYSWYSAEEKKYSSNLLHQDGRVHVLQKNGKAILLAQPLKRENGLLTSLRFDVLLPLYTPLDEIWIGESPVKEFPIRFGWEEAICIRDNDIFIGLQPLEPTNLGGEQPAVEINIANHHMIISVYNLRSEEPQTFPMYVLDQTNNGLIVEIGSRTEFDRFSAFRRHFIDTSVTERSWLNEQRQIHYESGTDHLTFVYAPETQEIILKEWDGTAIQRKLFECPNVVHGSDGLLVLEDVNMYFDRGNIGWLAYESQAKSFVAVLPTDHSSKIRLETPWGNIYSDSFSAGQISLTLRANDIHVAISTISLLSPVHFEGFMNPLKVQLNHQITHLKNGDVLELL